MRKDDIVTQVTSVLKKHKVSISNLQVRVDNRPSKKKEFKAKVDILVDRFTAINLLSTKTKLSDLLKDVKAIDHKFIVKTQLVNTGKPGYAIRLYLSKKPAGIQKFIQRKAALPTTALPTTALHNEDTFLNVKKGMVIEIINTPESISKSRVMAISARFIKLHNVLADKVRNIPRSFFDNKTVLIIN